jgi:predicted ribosome quality control (RQC) complex YloA/Tae2 family protein
VHNNYFFLKQLAVKLNTCLAECVVSECFTQNKEELVARFETTRKSFFIRASLLPDFSCLSFPDEFHRARKNSVDIFPEIIGQRIQSVYVFENERSLAIELTCSFTLVFKMHGNRANALLFLHGSVVNLFKKNLVTDRSLQLSALHRKIDWSRETFEAHLHKLSSLYVTFGKRVWSYWEEQNFSKRSSDDQWQHIQDVRQQLENPQYSIVQKSEIYLSLLPESGIVKKLNDPLEAVNLFYQQYTQTQAFVSERNQKLSQLKAELKSAQTYIRQAEARRTEITTGSNFRVWADLMMANLPLIPAQAEEVTLANFYEDNKPVVVKLKKGLSAQKNAELYYSKAKNQHIELEMLNRKLNEKQTTLQLLQQKINALESAQSLKEVRSFAATTSTTKTEKGRVPYNEYEWNGFKIWVGKNAKSNDELTLKFGSKEDLWLHAKDVAGSHVLIKHQAGKKFPKNVIERAAQLAAYHSKRKTDSLCPVAYTPKKYVRKRKGDPPGAVVVEREEVILVEPKNTP